MERDPVAHFSKRIFVSVVRFIDVTALFRIKINTPALLAGGICEPNDAVFVCHRAAGLSSQFWVFHLASDPQIPSCVLNRFHDGLVLYSAIHLSHMRSPPSASNIAPNLGNPTELFVRLDSASDGQSA